MADATAEEAVHEAAALPSASGAASREGDNASAMLAKLTSEPDVLLAAQQLGITTQHLMLRPLAAFQDKDDPDPELVKMRYNHHLSRRQALAEELQQHCDALRAEAARKAAAAPPPATPSKDGEPAAAEPPTPVLSTKEQRQAELDAKLAREAVKMARLAHKRQEDIAKILDFQMKQRESEQAAAEAREQELKKLEEARQEKQRREREKLEAKRLKDEEMARQEQLALVQAEKRRQLERARERERARQAAIAAKHAKREARKREEERKEMQRKRQQETQALFEAYERRVQEKAAASERAKQVRQAKFLEQQAEARRLVAERQAAAKARIEAARQTQERMAAEARAAYEERVRQATLRREAEERQHEEDLRVQREQQLAMALRRGKILETMRQDERDRVFGLIERMGKQEEAMEIMAEKRRRLADLREEERRLREQDRLDNVDRMLRAKQHHDEMLKQRFAEEDEREFQRKLGVAQMVETNRMASLTATQQKQELIDKLAKARGRAALEKLARDLNKDMSGAGGTHGSGGGLDGSAAYSRHGASAGSLHGGGGAACGEGVSAPATPRPPNSARPSGQPARPSTARARLA